MSNFTNIYFWWGIGILRYFHQLCRIEQVFIYKQGDKKEVAKEGILNRKIFGFLFVTAATPDTSPNEKEI